MSRLAALALPVLLALAACETTELFRGDPSKSVAEDEDFVATEEPLAEVDLEHLWARASEVLTRQGYPVSSDASSFARREMVSHWNTLLAPNRFEGRRSRAWVRFEETAPRAWTVSAAVQVQRNVDIDQPSTLSQAQWEDVAGKPELAEVILWKIAAGFRDPGAETTK
jgi:hypothetical protein